VPAPTAYDAAERVGATAALDAPAKPLAKAIRDGIPKGPVKDALSGVFLGHPVHPLLTDLVLGSWTSAVLMDLLREPDAARKLVGLGLATVPVTALSGSSDWADGEPASDSVRRVGFAHALVNVAGSALFAASYARRRRGGGRLLSLAGLTALGAGGLLGAHLSYAEGVGVDTTTFETQPQEWTAALPEAELRDDEPAFANVGEEGVVLVRSGGAIHALSDRCTHRAGALHDGEVSDGTITCPLHGSCFRLSDGGVVRGPAAYPQPRFETRVRDGKVEVRRA
jgi:nitrite reductase/ring-hydroxylating ferredoxin subunit/uncharacterized membrane protein